MAFRTKFKEMAQVCRLVNRKILAKKNSGLLLICKVVIAESFTFGIKSYRMKSFRNVLITAALLGALAILLGAFGAHGLKEKLSPDALDNYQTAVRYMMYHVLAILLLQGLTVLNDQIKKVVGLLFLLGILFFSGSIFLISLGMVEARSIWFITPIGGLFFAAGWLLMAYGLVKKT
jgi:uncharacterized membrane protein YgdD (TMEM256/DUF423 family)